MNIKVKIEIDGKESELTIEELRELRDSIDEILGDKTKWYPYNPLPTYPNYDEWNKTAPPSYPIITWC